MPSLSRSPAGRSMSHRPSLWAWVQLAYGPSAAAEGAAPMAAAAIAPATMSVRIFASINVLPVTAPMTSKTIKRIFCKRK